MAKGDPSALPALMGSCARHGWVWLVGQVRFNDIWVKIKLLYRWVDWRQYTLARHATSLLQLVDQLNLPNGREVDSDTLRWS